jgi:hypothetical protein
MKKSDYTLQSYFETTLNMDISDDPKDVVLPKNISLSGGIKKIQEEFHEENLTQMTSQLRY